MIELQRLPTLLTLSAAAFGAIVGKRFTNLAAVTVRTLTRRDGQEDLPLVRRTTPAVVIDRDMLRATKRFEGHKTPASELLFDYLRELGRGTLVPDSEYEAAFDRFEVLMGLLTTDAGGRATGCFAWRGGILAPESEYGPLTRVRKEFESQGTHWEPLRVGLFEGDPERVRKAFTGLTDIAKAVAGSY
jgi:hypothetical protein